jgi:hypothetical protein
VEIKFHVFLNPAHDGVSGRFEAPSAMVPGSLPIRQEAMETKKSIWVRQKPIPQIEPQSSSMKTVTVHTEMSKNEKQ